MSENQDRQAGADITEEMIAAGVAALRECVPLDVATPIMAPEDIVTAIFWRMRQAYLQELPLDRQ